MKRRRTSSRRRVKCVLCEGKDPPSYSLYVNETRCVVVCDKVECAKHVKTLTVRRTHTPALRHWMLDVDDATSRSLGIGGCFALWERHMGRKRLIEILETSPAALYSTLVAEEWQARRVTHGAATVAIGSPSSPTERAESPSNASCSSSTESSRPKRQCTSHPEWRCSVCQTKTIAESFIALKSGKLMHGSCQSSNHAECVAYGQTFYSAALAWQWYASAEAEHLRSQFADEHCGGARSILRRERLRDSSSEAEAEEEEAEEADEAEDGDDEGEEEDGDSCSAADDHDGDEMSSASECGRKKSAKMALRKLASNNGKTRRKSPLDKSFDLTHDYMQETGARECVARLHKDRSARLAELKSGAARDVGIVVLDACAGTGAALLALLRLNIRVRAYIAIEINPACRSVLASLCEKNNIAFALHEDVRCDGASTASTASTPDRRDYFSPETLAGLAAEAKCGDRAIDLYCFGRCADQWFVALGRLLSC